MELDCSSLNCSFGMEDNWDQSFLLQAVVADNGNSVLVYLGKVDDDMESCSCLSSVVEGSWSLSNCCSDTY